MTILSTVTRTLCIDPRLSMSQVMYNNVTPTDRTWAVRGIVGLSGGNTVQFATLEFFLIDNANAAIVAEYRNAQNEWVNVNSRVVGPTLTAHIGGSLDVWWSIFNDDSDRQCYDLFARAAHVTGI
jgi:hypothetical protein